MDLLLVIVLYLFALSADAGKIFIIKKFMFKVTHIYNKYVLVCIFIYNYSFLDTQKYIQFN